MKKDIKAAYILAVFMIVSGMGFLFTSASEGESPPGLAPINPDFLKYIEKTAQGLEYGYRYGYVPSPVKLSHIKGTIDSAVNVEYPSYYNLQDYQRVSLVKDQTSYPTCWTFAAYSSLESCLLPDEARDFSEWHLANTHGFDYSVYGAGNSWMTTAYLIRWGGPVDESLVPYPQESGAPAPRGSFPPGKHVQQVIFLPERTGPLDNNTIKYFLINYGAVDFAMYWDFSTYNSITSSQYRPGDHSQNHRLAIAGWDDNYPAENFRIKPPGNGAFIARNSWGRGWGINGYCYISYYDMSMEEFTCYNNAEPVYNYDSIYQHDPLGWISSWGNWDSWGANVFTAVDNRPLTAVGFYTNDANARYEIYVYKNVNNINANDPNDYDPRSGTLAAAKTGNFIYAGYYTVQLDTPVPLETGETFSVVVRFINPDYPFAVPLEIPIEYHSSMAEATPGESFASLDGIEWDDLTGLVPDANVCIKAYTEFPPVHISLQGERNVLHAWIISREYGEISFTIEETPGLSLSHVVLLRKIDFGDYRELQQIPVNELSNGRYSYWDYYLDGMGNCTYQVKAYDSSGRIAGKSSEITI